MCEFCSIVKTNTCIVTYSLQFLGGAVVKNLPVKAGDTRYMSSILGLENTSGVGNGYLLQYPGLENSMDREPWKKKAVKKAEC